MIRKNQKCFKIDQNKLDKSDLNDLEKENYIINLCSQYELILNEHKRIIYYFGYPAKLSKLEFELLHSIIKKKTRRTKIKKLIEKLCPNCKEDDRIKRAYDIKNRIKKKLKNVLPSIIIPCNGIDWSSIGSAINEIRPKSDLNQTDIEADNIMPASSMVKKDTSVIEIGYNANYPNFDFEGQFNKLIFIETKNNEKYISSKIKMYRYID